MRVLMAVVLLLAGCGGEDEVQVPATETGAAETAPETAHAVDVEAQLFGSDGQLRESDQVVAGLRLPRGLERVREEERRHVYLTRTALLKVQRYFGPRLITGQVDRIGDGAVYRRATVRDAQGGHVAMDVSILPTPGGTRVDIVELPPAPLHPPPEGEIIRQVNEQMNRMD